MVTFHLRSETKPFEHRSALTPTTTRALVQAGFTIYVERCTQRIFNDSDYEQAGATLVDANSWKQAPADRVILGLKELEEESFPLKNDHITFAHCYKHQAGWEKVLGRFPAGNSVLYDLEFLQFENGRRVAAFGFHAGFAGAAIGLLDLAQRITKNEPVGALEPYSNDDLLIDEIRSKISTLERTPRVLVIGALGRCGKGAVDLCRRVGIPDSEIVQWDMNETAKGGPFSEIVEDCDVFVNCIYLSEQIPAFATFETLSTEKRRVRVIVDVSADTTNPYNPIPVYTVATDFDKPTVPVEVPGPSLDVCSIDHLPTLLPREASEAFSADLLPHLLEFNKSYVWTHAKEIFEEHVAELKSQ